MTHYRFFASCITAIVLMVAAFAVPAQVKAAGGSGTVTDPYIIATLAELQAMNNNLTVHYALANDIDASATSGWNSGAGFVPIGSGPSASFLGSFDGRGYTITGLYINRPYTDSVGLFGHVGNSTATTVIKNVRLDGAQVVGASGVGTLIGRVVGNANILFEYCCSIDGSVTGGHAVGGLIGDHNSYQETPGGTNNPVVARSFADVSVSFSSVSGNDGLKFGGLVGCSQKGTISNCYARGSVTHTGPGARIGGLAGCLDYRGQINNSYSTGLVTVSNCTKYGGLLGNTAGEGNNAGVVINSFWDTQTSGQTTSAGGTGKTTAQMKTESTFTSAGWNFADIWEIISLQNDGYPCLRWYCHPVTIDFSNDPPYHTFGLIEASGTYESGLDHFTITNTSSSTLNITIHGTDMTGGGASWTLSDTASPGADTFGLKAGLEGGSYNIVVKKNATYNMLVSGLSAGNTQKWGLQLLAPTSFTDYIQKSGTIVLTATAV